MNEQFFKFKKQIKIQTAIKCALAAAAAAVVAVNVVLLSCYLSGVRLFWAWYLLIALGGLCLGGGVAFCLLHTNDKKTAARLDSELRLKERVQTALVYQNQEGDMLDLQRADTVSALSRVNKIKFRGLALTVALAAVFALGVCTLPIVAVYANAESGEQNEQPVDPPRPITDWEWQALDELIEYVKSSEKADETTKTGIVRELENLRSMLVVGVSQSSLPIFAQATVTNVRNIVREANEAEDVRDEQKVLNNEEGEYVVMRLYEIFALGQPDENDTPVIPPENPDDKKQTSGNNTGSGALIIDGVPFFDPERGYVSSGEPEVREKYYAVIQNAMLEGTISREEWEAVVAAYFADLRVDDEE